VVELFISARNLFFINDFGDNNGMSEDNLINQSRLESARKRRASRPKSHSTTATSVSRGGVSRSRGAETRGTETCSIETQWSSKSSGDKSASKVLTLAPKSYARNSLSGGTSTESGLENIGSSNSYSPMLLAALIREVENLDVPNGPFYL
jgi:hypothetical protein